MTEMKLRVLALIILVFCPIILWYLFYYASEIDNSNGRQAYTTWFYPALSIISAFVSISVTILVYDTWLRRAGEEERLKLIKSSIRAAVLEIHGREEQGFAGVYNDIKSVRFERHISEADSVFILQTYAPNIAGMRKEFIEALDRGCKINVALLKRDSPLADIRSKQLGTESKADFLAGIDSCVATLRRFSQESKRKNKISIFEYDDLPGISIYATNKVAFIGMFLSKTDSVDSPYFEVGVDSDLYEIFIAHLCSICDIQWPFSVKSKGA